MKKLTNPRMQLEKSMPPLAEALADFKGFSKGEHRGDRMFELLLTVIQRHRRATAQRFYTMRDVADFFGVALSTVASLYRRLDREGALIRARSSQTMIPARTPRPRLAVRGVVCMPIWLPGFINFRDWRIWFSELGEELSRHRFVLEPVFFHPGEEVDPAFVDRILRFNPDYVIWNAPALTDRMTMESIIDAGVSILSILGVRPPALPGRIYRTSHDRALSQGFREWKADGQIDRIVIPCLEGADLAVTENFRDALQTSPLPYQFKRYHHSRYPMTKYFASLALDQRTGIFFADQLFFIRFCALAAEELFQLCRRHRVLVHCQVMMQSWTLPADIFVDWLAVPTRRLARRIAEDLSQSKGALPSSKEIFEAKWRPHTPLTDLAGFYWNES